MLSNLAANVSIGQVIRPTHHVETFHEVAESLTPRPCPSPNGGQVEFDVLRVAALRDDDLRCWGSATGHTAGRVHRHLRQSGVLLLVTRSGSTLGEWGLLREESLREGSLREGRLRERGGSPK